MSRDELGPIVARLLEAAIGSKTIREGYSKALGALTINFSFLHFHVEVLSWDIFGVDHSTGRILTKDLPLKQLIAKFRSCMNHRTISDKDRKDIARLLRKIEEVTERRNELMHDLWLIHDGKPAFCYKRRGGGGKVPAPSISDINAFNRSVQGLTVELINFKDNASIRFPSFVGTGHPLEEIGEFRES